MAETAVGRPRLERENEDGAVYALYWLGKFPGETARARGHPQASAISVCGWLGLLFPPLWPIALICAYLNPRGQEPTPPPDLSGLRAALDAATAKVAQIEQRLGKTGAS
ncbi:DUF3302 domain-containing protein [Pseudaminobacter soli (ex Li et al. 2025)]|uniref:DUF3302 domain-containing protein n=1 Tax=Pseudaminobacter soli (ex Li et al. 2025) TaxID=1295366 RepID=UPI002474DEA0|nr:DUF3302 domain-containing protein [Mesorhizobium soli]